MLLASVPLEDDNGYSLDPSCAMCRSTGGQLRVLQLPVLTSSPQEFLNLSASLEHLRSVLFDLEDSLQNVDKALVKLELSKSDHLRLLCQYINHLVTV